MRQMTEQEMRETVGGSKADCVVGIMTFSLGLLAGAAISAATGGVATAGVLAIAGAYAPVATLACAGV